MVVYLQVDRSEVKSVGCVSEDKNFAQNFGIPNTKANCRLVKDNWSQCYKTFFGRNLPSFVISWSVCPRQAFPA